MDNPRWLQTVRAQTSLASRLIHAPGTLILTPCGARGVSSAGAPRVQNLPQASGDFPGGRDAPHGAPPSAHRCDAAPGGPSGGLTPSSAILRCYSGWLLPPHLRTRRPLPEALQPPLPAWPLCNATQRWQQHPSPQPRPQPQSLALGLPEPRLQQPLGLSRLAHLCTGAQSAFAAAATGGIGGGAAAAASAAQPMADPGATSASGALPPALLVVHPRPRGAEDREEALRLAESLVGRRCPLLEIGGSKLRPRRPSTTGSSRGPRVSGLRSTYFGSGTMLELARRLDALEAAETGISFESELGSRSDAAAVQQRQRLEDRGAEAAGGAAALEAGEAGEHAAGADGAEAALEDGSGAAGHRGVGGPGGVSGDGGVALPGGTLAGGGLRAPAFINEVLTPLQERNIEQGLGRPVVDRVGLILRLFAQRAHTREARLQVELASLSYMMPRLVRTRGADGRRGAFGGGLGWGGISSELGPAPQVVSARQRGTTGAGGLGGGGGSGDPELRQQRFRIKQRLAALRAELRAVAASRGVQRQGRRAAGLPTVAIVGYTNVGKTSLAGAMCSGDAGLPPPSDMLFATLDPAVRRVWLPTRGSHVAVSDTVGFIRDLPVGLVAAFRATLEEVVAADMLLHVLDASSPNVVQQRDAVLAVLRQLGVSEHVLARRTIEVWNKVDLLGRAAEAAVRQSHGAAVAAAPLSHGGGGGARRGGAAVSSADAAAAQAASIELLDKQEDEDEEADEEEDREDDLRGESDDSDVGDGERVYDGGGSSALRHRGDGNTGGGGGGGDSAGRRHEWRCTAGPPEGAPTAVMCDGARREGEPADEWARLRSPGTSRAVVWADDRSGAGLGCANSGPSGEHVKTQSPAATAPSGVPPPRRPVRRLFGGGLASEDGLGGHLGGDRGAPPQPASQPPPAATTDCEEPPPGPQPPLQPSSPTPQALKAEELNGIRRMLHSAAGARPRPGLSLGRAAGSDAGLGLGLGSADATTECVEDVEGVEGVEGVQEVVGGAGGWDEGACVAAAADLVRQVHAAGGSPPAAVVLAAVAEGGGVAEVKAAIDAVLRMDSSQPAAAASSAPTAMRGGAAAAAAAATGAGGWAGSTAAALAAAAAAATAGETAMTGRWVSPLLWMAYGIPWPLPPPSPHPASRFAAGRRRAAAGAYGAGAAADELVDPTHKERLHTSSGSGGYGGDGGSDGGRVAPSLCHEAKAASATTEQHYGRAAGGRWTASWRAAVGPEGPYDEAKAAAGDVPTDGEELEELIRFLRRRRPRGKSDE